MDQNAPHKWVQKSESTIILHVRTESLFQGKTNSTDFVKQMHEYKNNHANEHITSTQLWKHLRHKGDQGKDNLLAKNMYTDQTISFGPMQLKAATSLSQWTRASAQKHYHPAARSSWDGTRWQATLCWSCLGLWMCAVPDHSHGTLATCGASACSQPQNSHPALGPTRQIFCSTSGRCACCVWK